MKRFGLFFILTIFSFLHAEEIQKKDVKKPFVKNNEGLFIKADFLYWKVRNNSWIFALKPLSETSGPPKQNEYSTTRPDFKWEPGFKVATGYLFPNYWDISIDWTYSHSKTKNTLIDPSQNILLSTFAGAADVGYVTGNWDINYNTWDLEFGKTITTGRHFVWRPFFGLRGAYFKQEFDNYAADPTTDPAAAAPDIFPFQVNTHDKFWGVGIRSGLDAKFFFCQYMGLLGKVSGALLYGEVDAPNFVKRNIGAAPSAENPEQHVKVENKYYESKPAAQLLIGLFGGKYFQNDTKYLGIKVAFEMNYWWDQENSHTFGMSRDSGTPLEFAGLTLSGKVEF